MISENGTRACFVYLMLPGETRFVTAGKFETSSGRHGVPQGRFIYGKSYLERHDAVPIDPHELKLGQSTYQTQNLKGIFGAIRDASPDYWGRRVIEKHAGFGPLGEMDYLLHSPDDRAGALGFGLSVTPPAPLRKYNRTMQLESLQATADAIISDQDLPANQDAEQTQELLLPGTSMGGARPKTVIEDGNSLWVSKFNRTDDRWNEARIEHAMLLLARECGIQSAESRVISVAGRDMLLVKRFDRQYAEEGYRRARMLSALTLLGAGDDHLDRQRWSYLLLAEELRRISSQPGEDCAELFRRMCFNALISNTDDHPRNHAVIALGHDWKLSPAYDLTPSTPVSQERRDLAMECGDMGRIASAENLLSQHARFLLKPDHAAQIINEVTAIIKNGWYAAARRAGVTERDCEKIQSAFVYPGFEMEQS